MERIPAGGSGSPQSRNSNGTPSSSPKSVERDYVFVNLPSSAIYPEAFRASTAVQAHTAGSGGGRSKWNLTRTWKSFSRLQRNLIWAIAGIFLCSIVLYWLRVKSVRFSKPSAISLETSSLGEESVDFLTLTKKFQEITQKSKSELPGIIPSRGDLISLIKSPVPMVFKGPQNEKQKAIVDAFLHSWKGYKAHAWGHDHLKPVSKSHHDWFSVGLTIVDSLDTIYIMGLNKEFAEARQWVAESLTFDLKKYVNLFEMTIRALGGLLSAFHLSGDKIFAEKAKDLGERLIGAFDTPSRIPYSDKIHNLRGCANFHGVCPMFINPKTGQFRPGTTLTFGARADSYYEYLLKQWLQTGKTVDWLKTDYVEAMEGMRKHLLRESEPSKFSFIGELIGEKSFSPKMDHLVCFIAGTMALGSINGLGADHLEIAERLAHTCYQMYAMTATGLAPEIAHFNQLPGAKTGDINIKPLDAHYLLRPETVESLFYLYRITKKQQYRDWGWKIFEAIEKHAKISGGGYSSVTNVKKLPVQYKDMMESFFLGETLKYLYLLFEDDFSVLPFDQWIFNTEAHPLPIRTK